MNSTDTRLLRHSLILVWLATTVISLIDWHGAGSRLLLQAGLSDARMIQILIWGGSALDLMIGMLLWLKPGRRSYQATLIALALLTLTASILLPALWLDPLGPLLKNLPIAAIVLFLLRTEKYPSENHHA